MILFIVRNIGSLCRIGIYKMEKYQKKSDRRSLDRIKQDYYYHKTSSLVFFSYFYSRIKNLEQLMYNA